MAVKKTNKLFSTLLVFVILLGLLANLFLSQSQINIQRNDSISLVECQGIVFNLLSQASGNTIFKNIVFHLTEAESSFQTVSLRYNRLKGWANQGRTFDDYLSGKSYAKPPESIYLQDNLLRIISYINDKDGKK